MKRQMKKEVIFETASNEKIAADVYDLRLKGDCRAGIRAGQFVEVALDGFFLRRPISVCDVYGDGIRLVYKVTGKGTEYMSSLKKGDRVRALTGLGNGFSLDKCKKTALICGGGVGAPPLLLLAKRLIESGKNAYVALGFNSAADVAAALPRQTDCDFFFACGPKAMLKALSASLEIRGEVSLEERMGCGFGACMGCAVNTTQGVRRVCADGPVFSSEEVIW